MKNTIFTLLLIAVGTFTFAQAPESINYQAAIRDADGLVVKSSPIGVSISIIQDSATGSKVYTETFTVTTSKSGLINLQIGTGASTLGAFADIDWSSGSHHVELSLDITGGIDYKVVGTTQMLSVPYALYTKTTERTQVVSKVERFNLGEVKQGTMIFCSDCGASGELQVYNGTEWTNFVGGPIVE